MTFVPVVLPGVYRPISDTALLASLLDEVAPGRRRALDLCTGTGVLAIRAALAGAHTVEAVDVDRRAVWNARLNARRAQTRVRVHHGDLDAPVQGRRFDLITSNPPYLPATSGAREVRRWDAGADGRRVLDRICDALPALLAPGGTALIVQSSFADADATAERLRASGVEVTLAASHRGPPGPIAAARADELRARGLLPPDGTEELVVLRADEVSDCARVGMRHVRCTVGPSSYARSSTRSPARGSTAS